MSRPDDGGIPWTRVGDAIWSLAVAILLILILIRQNRQDAKLAELRGTIGQLRVQVTAKP